MDDRLPSWICFDSPTKPPSPQRVTSPRRAAVPSSHDFDRAATADDDVDDDSGSSPCRRRRRVSSFDRIMQSTTCSRLKTAPPHTPTLSSPRRKRATMVSKEHLDDSQQQLLLLPDQVSIPEDHVRSIESLPSSKYTIAISPIVTTEAFLKTLCQVTPSTGVSSPMMLTAHQNEISPLVSLCRQGLWSRAFKRCQTHPHEAIPVLIRPNIEKEQGNSKCSNNNSTARSLPQATTRQENGGQAEMLLFETTALGLVCSANWTNHHPRRRNDEIINLQAQQAAQDDQREDDTCAADVLLTLIQALLDICPQQVQCSQSIAGHTPLRDALKNPSMSPRALALLLLTNSRLSSAATHLDSQQQHYSSQAAVAATVGLPSPPAYPTLSSALHQCDRDGLYPIDHVILGVVHEENSSSSIHTSIPVGLRKDDNMMANDASSTSCRSIDILATFLRHASPDCFADPVDDGSVLINDMDSDESIRTSESRRTRASPLVRLFSLGHSTAACGGNSNRQHQKTCATPHSSSSPKRTPNMNGQEDNGAVAAGVARILQCTRLLLQVNNPCLIYVKSPTTLCLPIHVALRNYGNESELIRELMDADHGDIAMRQRNHYGDLPLHVACSSGVPMDILRLVLARTLASSLFSSCPPPAGMPRATVLQVQQSSSHHGFSGGESGTAPDPLIWSTNNAGYTPVDLEWIRHIEAGSGFFSHRAFYPLDPTGVQRPRGRYDDLYDSLLRQAVDQVLLERPEATRSTDDTSTTGVDSSVAVHRQVESDRVFGLLLHRIFLIIRSAFHDSFSRSPFDLSGDILHQASALCLPHDPTLPVPILELILSQYPEQVSQRDHLGKLPLHHAVQVHGGCGGLNSDRRASAWLQWTMTLLRRTPDAACVRDGRGRLPLHCALDASSAITNAHAPTTRDAISNNIVPQVDIVLKELIGHYPEAVEVQDPVTGLFPFMLAALNPLISLDRVFILFRRSTTTFPTRANLKEF